jgi:hypothetical protein
VTGADERYYPFGEKRLNGNMQTDKLFTGQREIAALRAPQSKGQVSSFWYSGELRRQFSCSS